MATWAFRGIGAANHAEPGLFTSLNNDARDSLVCLASVPVLLPAALTAISLYLAYGSFYISAREVLVGPNNPYRLDVQRGILVNGLTRQLGTGWRAWLAMGWWLCAIVAGAVTVAVTGIILRGIRAEWLAWLLVAASIWLILKMESSVTVGRYQGHDQLPDSRQAAERLEQWLAARPDDQTGMPWIYAYSGLTAEEIYARFRRIITTGPVGFTAKLLGLVTVVLVYSILPAPSVDRFKADGLIGCLFANLHNLAGVAKENLILTIIVALVLLILLPLSIQYSYGKFMIERRFPLAAILEVLRREAGFGLFMRLAIVPMMTISGVVMALILWLSAGLAHWTDSPLVGVIALIVPSNVFLLLVTRSLTRGALPKQRNSAPE